jgi:hypothetical protein
MAKIMIKQKTKAQPEHNPVEEKLEIKNCNKQYKT